ncbi:MAG TPA: hypothetical protein VF753_17470 [Terriglobales bacterium]
MKRFILMTCFLSSVAALGADPAKQMFHGEISDSQCAMNVHSLSRSHEEMIVKNTFGTNAASCARTCVRRGGEWVLRSGDVVYHLRNQEGVDNFAGEKVRITGMLDPKNKIIDNITIEPETTFRHVQNTPQ